jgi:serine/threonine protein kinase
MLDSGQDIGSYQIVGPLGAGATGLVYRAKHSHLGHEVAIKVLRPELAQRPDTASRFLAEARAINDIGHPNIVKVHDFAKDAEREPPIYYMVMELLEGFSLGDHLHKAGFLRYTEALRIAGQVASALAAVHASNRVHRDLKSDNIFVVAAPGSEGLMVKLLDFGLVKVIDEDLPQVKMTDPGTALGTPAYMAPEQVLEGADIDRRTDIYALGVVLYEMLTGALPFQSKSYGQLMVQVVKERPRPPTLLQEGIPRPVEALVMRCLEKKPVHRYQSAEELSQAIAVAGGGLEDPLTIDAEPAEESPLEEGARIGSYKLLRTIGKGGMGRVYLAVHESLQRKVALKLLSETYAAAGADAVQRVFREALAASRINHPNIVAITDFIQDGDTACYVMEYLEGEPLIARLRRGGMSLDDALSIAEQTADGLAALHDAGVIHRDLKPGNIFLVERPGQPVQIKLLDFGLAELSDEVAGDLEGGAPNPAMITPEYCSPEQIRSPRLVDHRADIYAFGVVLYLMVVGRRPHEASSEDELLAEICSRTPPTPSQHGLSLPRGLEQLIMSCLSIDPDGRPANATEVLEALRDVIRHRAAAESRKRARGRFPRWLAGIALIAVLAGGFLWWQHRSPSPPAPAARPADVAIADLKTMLREVTHRARDKVAFAPARRGMDLHHLDAIKTGARSRALLSFRAGGRLDVDEWTTVLIEAPAADEEKLPIARLKKGTVHTEVRPGRSLRVISPGGRESLIRARGDKPVKLRVRQRKDGLEVAVLGGNASISSAGRSATVGAGQFVDIGRGRMTPAHLPPFPELLSPAVDATVTGAVVLRWHTVGAAGAFHVQLSKSHSFRDNLIETRLAKRALVLEPGALAPGRYVWRVSSIDADAREGEFGYSRRFTVAEEPRAPSAEDFEPRDNKVVSVIKESAVVTFRWPPGVKGHTLLVTRGRQVVVRKPAAGQRARVRLEPGTYRWKLVDRDRTPAFRPPRRLILRLRTPPEVIPKVRWPGRKNP